MGQATSTSLAQPVGKEKHYADAVTYQLEDVTQQIVLQDEQLEENQGSSCFLHQNVLHVIGKKSFQIDMTTLQITTVPSQNRFFAHGKVVKNRLVLIAGSDASIADAMKNSTLTTILIYNLETMTWLQRPYKAQRCAAHSVAQYGDTLYVHGGFDGSRLLNTVVEYNVEQDTTVVHKFDKHPLCQFRSGHSAVTYYTDMIVYGGGSNECFTDVYAWNYETKLWRQLPISRNGAQPENRYGHACCMVHHYMVIYGGCVTRTYFNHVEQRVSYGVSNDLYMLNMHTNTWTQVQCQDLPKSLNHCMVPLSATQVLCLGGTRHDETVDDCIRKVSFSFTPHGYFVPIPQVYGDVKFFL